MKCCPLCGGTGTEVDGLIVIYKGKLTYEVFKACQHDPGVCANWSEFRQLSPYDADEHYHGGVRKKKTTKRPIPVEEKYTLPELMDKVFKAQDRPRINNKRLRQKIASFES